MARTEWCQCEQDVHQDAGPVMCTCPATPAGVRFASRRCPVHNGDQHPYGVLSRTVAPRSTAFGTIHVCLPCRQAGHMGVRA